MIFLNFACIILSIFIHTSKAQVEVQRGGSVYLEGVISAVFGKVKGIKDCVYEAEPFYRCRRIGSIRPKVILKRMRQMVFAISYLFSLFSLQRRVKNPRCREIVFTLAHINLFLTVDRGELIES